MRFASLTLCSAFAAALLLACGSGTPAPTGAEVAVDATATSDVSRAPDVSPTADVPVSADIQTTAPEVVQAPDPCAKDNGGCGPAPLYSCTPVAGKAQCAFDATADYAALTQGVQPLDYGGGLSSTLVLHELPAFALATAPNGEPVVAAARYGKGRVVFVGHEGMLGGKGAAQALIQNALAWLGQPAATNGLAMAPGLNAFSEFAKAAKLQLTTAALPVKGQHPVWVATVHTQWKNDEVEQIRQFVEAGGGLLLGGHAWYWASGNGNVANGFAANRVLKPMGITLTGAVAELPNGKLNVDSKLPPSLVHARTARDAVVAHVLGEKVVQDVADRQLIEVIAGRAIEVLPLDWPWYGPAMALVNGAAAFEVSESKPLNRKANPIEALAVRLRVKLALEQQVDLVKPDAADFPGSVPANAPALGVTKRTLDLDHAGLDPRYGYADAKDFGWRSTGIYLPPGAKLTVKAPSAAVGKGLLVQVGSHTDTLYGLESWKRMPAVVRTAAITSPTTEIASGFGGLVYVLVPVGAKLGQAQFEFTGGVAAPYYQLGVTTQAQWQQTERNHPGPWAELAGKRFIGTVPSSAIRTLDDPGPVVELWDKILDADAALAGFDVNRPRAERLVVDRQISAGSLHSGYPIMGHPDSTAPLVDLNALQAGAWGPLHELGHNHQWLPWVLPGTTESSCNLWSVYASEQVLGIDRGIAHPALAPADRKARIADHLAKGAPLANWSVWTALETYLQLQEKFGWKPLTQVMTEYRAVAPADDPKTDADKFDAWIVRTSKAVGMDLGEFYAAWGLPMSAAAKQAVAGLPVWKDHPLAAKP